MSTAVTTKGIAAMLLAGLLFTLLDATAKHLVGAYPTWQVIWARYTGQCAVVALALAPRLRTVLRTRYPGLQVLRSIAQLGATGFFFLSLRYVGLADATAIAELAPLLITLGAALFLGETIGPRRIAGIVAAMIGALIVIRPGSSVFAPSALLPLATAFCYAAYVLFTRRVGQSESVWTSLLYTALLGALVTSLALPGVWRPVAAGDLWAFAALAVLGSGGQFFLIRAFSLSEAGAIAPFAYIELIYAALWGALFFAEWPDAGTIAGGAVIVGAGIYVWHREGAEARRAKRAAAARGEQGG
ncbi:DMT family transporter [Acidimangrovimonas sediminis]|uniref:DMT family transporter n=1 Tax=Acidimangrovimonas sediminis TaxID=2056283 RepID=UPI000C8017BF|nr:DMT family transporter [Acidimangrovimonas sediminis]